MRLKHSVATLALVALATFPARAQVSGIPADEAHAFALKSAGRYDAALDAFLALAEQRAAGGARDAAHAEVFVRLAEFLAVRAGANDTAPRFAALARDAAGAHPVLADRARHAALALARRSGDLGTVVGLQRELGHLTRFWICGPFDNERGQGFARAFPPEQGFDPTATFDGKKRPVAWRRLPVDEPPAGVVDLGALQRPSTQVLVHAATALVAERDTDAMLLLGTDGAHRVFLNGAEVGAHDVRRARAPDQDALALHLRRGANLLVLKLCAQDGPLTFAARLRAPDGRPLAGVRDSDAEADLTAAAATRGVTDAAPVQLARGALDVLGARAETDAADAFRLATLLALDQPDDPSERRDRQLAERAVAALPDFTPARYLLAFTRVQQGNAEEKDDNQRRQDYETILAAEPDHAEALRALAEMELEDVGAAQRAEALCRRALAVDDGFALARLLLADALKAQQLDLLAARETLRAAAPSAAGHRSAEALRAASQGALRVPDHRRAEELATAALVVAGEPGDAERLGDLLLRRGARRDALAILDAAILAHPFDVALCRARATALEGAGELDAAEATWSRWLELCPEDDDALVELARLAGLRDDVERQRELLRAALDLNPNRKTEARLLEFLEAGETPFHAGYELDAAAILAAHGTPPADATAANDSHYWVLTQDVVRAYRNGTRSVYQHRIVRLVSDRAVRAFSVWVVRHDPNEQRARILSARVLKADGRELRPQLRGAVAQLPPLEVGDVIDVTSRIDDVAPTFFGDYFGLVHRFVQGDGQPVGRSDLVLVLDPGRTYRFQSANGAPDGERTTDADGREVVRFTLGDLPRRDAEDRAPGLTETAPLVRVTTYADWDAFASWWWNLIRRQTDVTDEMRAKVAELTADATSELEKIAAIYAFVTNDVRYKAWEFGVHGYKPYNTSVIFERRHGDCKDKALLLDALLGVAGIEAWPVLIRAEPSRDVDDLSLAMVEHFNHCISWLPPRGDRPGMFLDGTATWHAIDTVPEMDQGARVLVVRGPSGELHDVDYVDADANVDARRYDLELRPDGAGRGVLVAEPRRNQAVPLREFLANEPGRTRENVERWLARTFRGATVTAVDPGEPRDVRTPIRLEVAFDGADLAAAQGGGLSLRAALGTEPLQRFTAAPTRVHPLLLGVPDSERIEIRYRLPDGWAPAELPAPVSLTAPFGRYELAWSFADGVLTVRRERALTTARIEAPEYPEFREFAGRADAADDRAVVVRPEGR